MSEEVREVFLTWLKDVVPGRLSDYFYRKVVHEGDEVILDESKEFFQCLRREVEVETWLGGTQIYVIRGGEYPKIGVNWFDEMVNFRSRSLVFEDDGGFYPDQLEGEEKKYIDKFMELVTNPEINPLGFPLQDGVYRSPAVKFDICFGLSGKPAHLVPLWPEGWNLDPLSLPWEMVIEVVEDLKSPHPKNEDGELVRAGVYTTSLKVWERNPPFVSTMQLEGSGDVYMNEETFLHYVVDGKIYILDIRIDKRRRY